MMLATHVVLAYKFDKKKEELDELEVANIVISAVDASSQPFDGLLTDLDGDLRPGDTRRRINVLPPVTSPSPLETQQRPVAPLTMDAVTKIYTEPGPVEHTPEHAAIESKFGFSYCSLREELMYA